MHMEQELHQRLLEQEKKIDLIYASVEKTRKYLFWTMVATVAFFILPLIALALFVPSLMASYTSTLTDLGL